MSWIKLTHAPYIFVWKLFLQLNYMFTDFLVVLPRCDHHTTVRAESNPQSMNVATGAPLGSYNLSSPSSSRAAKTSSWVWTVNRQIGHIFRDLDWQSLSLKYLYVLKTGLRFYMLLPSANWKLIRPSDCLLTSLKDLFKCQRWSTD